MPEYSIIGGLSLQELKTVQEILGHCEKLERAQLFGSRAMNTHKPTSDVDLALFDDSLSRSDVNALKIAFEDSALPHTFDLVLHHSIKEPELLAHIQRRAVNVYRKDFYLSEDGEWVPEGWTRTYLGNVSRIKQYGYTESACENEVGPRFLRITDIQNDFVDWHTVPYCPISESDYKKYKLKIGDLLIARTGNSTGAVTTIKDKVDAVFASYLIRFKPNFNKVDFRFLDFLTRSRLWTSFVNSVKKGSAQGGANANDFAAFPIKLPPLPEQKSIADVLGSLDDKIELLREQNETLEALAQTLFKRWFIDFNFPDKNGNSYKDSGGKMIPSELGDIPDGWKVGKLSEAVNVRYGKNHKALNDGGYPCYGSGGIMRYVERTLCDNESVLIPRKGTLSNLMYVREPFWSMDTMFFTEFRQDNFVKYFYLLMERVDLEEMNVGSAVPSMTTAVLNEMQLIYPDAFNLRDFEELCERLYAKTESNTEQIETLTQLRNTLLPKLMKGEIRIPIKS